jgi:hypothetical protein
MKPVSPWIGDRTAPRGTTLKVRSGPANAPIAVFGGFGTDNGAKVSANGDTLKLIAAAIVRDFLVVEERESLFTARRMRRAVNGRPVRTVIYLPRVRYSATALHTL